MQDQPKRCGRCGEVKPADQFYKLGNGRLHGYCAPCQRDHSREWRQQSREKVRAQKRRHYVRHAERLKEKQRKYHAAHPEEVRNNNAKGRLPDPTQFVEPVSALVALELTDGLCGICGEDVDPFAFDLDHIVPLARGGPHAQGNVQPAHPSCNRAKSAK